MANNVNPFTGEGIGIYIVQDGDTLSGIAAKYNMTLDQLVRLNPQIADINKIYIGQEIHI